jgi:hypothetical protein
MSETNSIAPTSDERPQAPDKRPAFDIPEDLANRYQIRVIEGSAEGERRIGMFIGGDTAAQIVRRLQASSSSPTIMAGRRSMSKDRRNFARASGKPLRVKA